MKTKHYLFGALAAMMLMTSCQDDTALLGNEGEVMVSFNLETPQIATRAFSDGSVANLLQYAVYDQNDELLPTHSGTVSNFTGSATINLKLSSGNSYSAIFWAANENAPYTVNFTDKTMTVNYTNAVSNDETRDAFYKYQEFTVEGNQTVSVELKRPFAQLNIGTNDFDEATDASYAPTQSAVTVKEIANTLNLCDGTVSGEQDVTFGYNAIPSSSEDFPVGNYEYLAMNYVLVGSEKEVHDIVYMYRDNNNLEQTNTVGSVPMQRNYRTNIYGSLLTNNINVTVDLEPDYDAEINNGTTQAAGINETFYATIQEAINAAKAGDVIKVAEGSYTEILNVTGGKNITIEAVGKVAIAGLDHQSNGTPSTIKVKGITFDNSLTTAGWFTGTSQNITPCVGAWGGNISFEDCKFIVDGNTGKETGVMTWWTTNTIELSFDNCTFEGKNNHANARAMQIYGNVNMKVNNCTFNTYKDYTLKYVAQDGNVADFTNNTVNNSENFVELGSSTYPGNNYTANIIGNTLGEGVNTHVIANVENQIVNCSGNVQVIADGLIIDANGNYVASNVNGLKAAIAAGATTINLTANTYNATSFDADGKTLTLRGVDENVILNINQNGNEALGTFDGSKVTFENITIKTPGGNYKGFARMQGTYNNCKFENLYFTFKGKHEFNACSFNAGSQEHCLWTYGADEVVFNDCEFNYNDRCINVYTTGGVAEGVLTCNDCTFSTSNASSKGAVEINSGSFSTSIAVNMNDCTAPAHGEMVFISGWDSTNGAKATVTIDGVVTTVPQLAK